MKAFAFSLQKVLDYREQTLSVKKNELAALHRQLSECDDRIKALEGEFDAVNQKRSLEMSGGMTSARMEVYRTYLEDLNKKIQLCVRKKQQLLLKIEQKKQELTTLKTEITGLEKLRDRQRAEYDRAARKLEETAIEEFVGIGVGKRRETAVLAAK